MNDNVGRWSVKDDWSVFFFPYNVNNGSAYGVVTQHVVGSDGVEWSVLKHNRGPVTGIKWSGIAKTENDAKRIIETMWAWVCGTSNPPPEALTRDDGKWGAAARACMIGD